MLPDATRCCKDIAKSWVSRNLAKILYMCIAISPETLLEKTSGASYGFSFFRRARRHLPQNSWFQPIGHLQLHRFYQKTWNRPRGWSWRLRSDQLGTRSENQAAKKSLEGFMKRMKYWIMYGYEMRLVCPGPPLRKTKHTLKEELVRCFWVVSFWNHNHLNRVWCSVLSNCAVW